MKKTNHFVWQKGLFHWSLFLFITPFFLVVSCAHIPANPYKSESYSHSASVGLLVDTSQSVMKEADSEASAFLFIRNNEEALRWRLALIDHAQKSIDLQTYIWSNDESGRLMLDRIIKAAQRGVKVRILIDDMPKDWSDDSTALVARIPLIQLRRFNPGRVRKGAIQRTVQMGVQFKKLNRRMHNKQMVVDGAWGVIGGRNIGNPYFGLSTKYNNRDLDLLITGAILPSMISDFDLYWNADATYPGEAMSNKLSDKKITKMELNFATLIEEDQKLFVQTRIPITPSDWSSEFAQLPQEMVMGVAQLMTDLPKVKGDRGVRLIDQLKQVDIKVEHQSCIITPYMIPSKEQLAEVAQQVSGEQRKVRLLVPSMASNNHTVAHSHYKKYRHKILDAGVELYEFRAQPSAAIRADSDTAPIVSDFISLHTKAFVFDQSWVLVGSLNVDPRSIKINTEHMLIIQSAPLAAQLLSDFEQMTSPENAWLVTRTEKGKLRWVSSEGIYKKQPARSVFQRWSDSFLRWMPIEGQL